MEWSQLGLFTLLLFLSAKPLGRYLEKVFDGDFSFLPLLGPLERMIYRAAGIDPEADQTWTQYAISLLIFSAVTFFFTYSILRLQGHLPLNPQQFMSLRPDLAFNTAVSFATNTDWQSYGGESTMSHLSQMVALVFQDFISAAVGTAALVGLIRGLTRRQGKGIGNFWADLVRGTLFVFLPLSFVLALFLMSQGVIQSFHAYREVLTLEGAKQLIAQGPVASQAAIKLLGSNGGGFFNANTQHPYENPTALSNFLQAFSMLLVPSGLVYLLGLKAKDLAHARAIWATMAVLFVAGAALCAHFEASGNPGFLRLGVATSANLEGKETRFGVFQTSLIADANTASGCGSMGTLDSFTPLGGMVGLINLLVGEVIFGSVGSGLSGMILYVLLTVFIAGLMTGRTPEYLGKKIGGREIKYVMLTVVLTALSVLAFTAWGALDSRGLSGLGNAGPHGFTEILYAYSSATTNNGSAFGGLSANTPFWNITLGLAMFFGRYLVIVPVLALAGSLTEKKVHPGGTGTFPTRGPLFIGILLGVVLLVGALTFIPALTLGPIAEHFEMQHGRAF